jgi:hypothetical protein
LTNFYIAGVIHPARLSLVALAGLLATLGWSSWRPDELGAVEGRVLAGDEPLAAARVGWQTRPERVLADAAGRFRLPAPPRPAQRIAAWKEGYYIGTAAAEPRSPMRIVLSKHPRDDCDDYAWVDPNPDPAHEHNCANCHAEIYRQWSASAHAGAAINRHFLDVFAGTDWSGQPGRGWSFADAHPEARAVCVACHLPGVAADDPVAEDPRLASGVAREGIHCDICHKVAATSLSAHPELVGIEHGRLALDMVRPRAGRQIFFGPLDDAERGQDTYAPIYRSSLYCASCHEGTLFGTRAYTTFSEWRGSAYARAGVQCQNCHMKPDGVLTNIAPGHGGVEREPGTLASHRLAGASDAAFLRSAVELRVDARQEAGVGIALTTTVRPIGVGHRLPTGSPDRHLILLVQAQDRHGAELSPTSGPVIGPEGGWGPRAERNYGGAPGKIYGKLLEDAEGDSPAPFWNAVALRGDTRLAPDEVDSQRFVFAGTEAPSPLRVRVRVRLIYRSFYKSVLDAKAWPDPDITLADQTVHVE